QLVGEDQVVLLDCTSRTCGGFDFREAVETIPPPEMIVDLALFGYLAVRNGISGQVDFALLSLAGGTGYLQHVSVTPAPAPVIEMPSETESTEALETPTKEEGLFAGRGTIVLEGLEFETGSAALSDADYPGLRELAAFLASNPDATVILVGHTDAEGNLEPNITLSRQRAEAVRTRLINGFRVPPAQLLADGVGYLAPRATNTTQEGRLRNRRVEAVLMAR
ncbi:MAG: OmpA family protein, partial [Dinoroseobacter sp.]|nr:OmpA family protein [Dinoroseobacter sp.]